MATTTMMLKRFALVLCLVGMCRMAHAAPNGAAQLVNFHRRLLAPYNARLDLRTTPATRKLLAAVAAATTPAPTTSAPASPAPAQAAAGDDDDDDDDADYADFGDDDDDDDDDDDSAKAKQLASDFMADADGDDDDDDDAQDIIDDLPLSVSLPSSYPGEQVQGVHPSSGDAFKNMAIDSLETMKKGYDDSDLLKGHFGGLTKGMRGVVGDLGTGAINAASASGAIPNVGNHQLKYHGQDVEEDKDYWKSKLEDLKDAVKGSSLFHDTLRDIMDDDNDCGGQCLEAVQDALNN